MTQERGKHVVAGVDVSSNELVVRISVDTKVLTFSNNLKGIRALIQLLSKLEGTLVVCEHTGRYEWELCQALWEKGVAVHCAQPKAVHNFAKARKANGKSDPIDAETIMQYGLKMDVEPTKAPSPEIIALRDVTNRRDDLNGMLVQEKNRLQAPGLSPSIRKMIRAHVSYLEKAIDKTGREIEALIKSSPSLQAPIECLDKQHGVGLVSAATIYANMPELGTLSRQTAGALAGLAPLIRESGKYSGQRKISGGRSQVRNALYMVALSVIRKKNHVLHSFYIRLKKAGKKNAVALTAVMRKLIVYFNSQLKELRTQKATNPC